MSGVNLVTNRGLARGGEWVDGIEAGGNDALILMVLSTTGLDTDAVLRDTDSFDDIITTQGNDEADNTNYARKTIDETSLTITVDDTNDRLDIDCNDETWTGVAAGDVWAKIVIGFDSDTLAGNDTNIIPWTMHSFDVTPDGSDITAQIATGGFFRATSAA